MLQLSLFCLAYGEYPSQLAVPCPVSYSQRPAPQKHPPNFGNSSPDFSAPDEKQKNMLSCRKGSRERKMPKWEEKKKNKNTRSCSLTSIFCSCYRKKAEASRQTHCLSVIIPLSSSPRQAKPPHESDHKEGMEPDRTCTHLGSTYCQCKLSGSSGAAEMCQ